MSLFERLIFIAINATLVYALYTSKIEVFDATFLALLVIYFGISIKIYEWSTLYSLGRKMETPELFMSNVGFYHKARILLLVTAFVVLFFMHKVASYLGLAGLAVTWATSPWIGRTLAFVHIRRIGREMVEEINNLKVSDPAQYACEVAEGAMPLS